ncbi:type IX secretion system membrane protein PorP/SprF [Fulvivirga sp. RKSG066]|uniref:PorP/SprF family type IX secretion system membrane protein n=1 Tax=Fulvivirga aurantia TaxID=2529383 RepID=UPI0012BC1B2F|nr:type IX secretion system membrane protein PorP/SprF [Fulvivirga aurantia]MTI22576.1 type IX secretion system membrane protein PorP/SprF [Fulvivirga aurantia]
MKKLLLTLFAIGFSLGLYAQDPQFSQFYNAPLYLNPGFTGITPQQRVVLNHRLQWPTLPQAYSTYAVSYEMFVGELKSGFGLMATTDKQGSSGWRTSTASLLYSYKLRVSKDWVVSPGLIFGYGQQSVGDKLTFGDELDTGVPTSDPDVNRLGTTGFFDIGSGIILYNRMVWLGFAAYHINQPNRSVLGGEARLPMKMNFHGGMRIPLKTGMKITGKIDYLTPSFIYRSQGPFQQLDLGLQYHIDPVAIGFWYRGIPVPRAFQLETDEASDNLQDALAFVLSLQFNTFQVGYSYDFTISELGADTGGAHEISIIYEFVAKPFRRGVKKKYQQLPCPTFNSKAGFWN